MIKMIRKNFWFLLLGICGGWIGSAYSVHAFTEEDYLNYIAQNYEPELGYAERGEFYSEPYSSISWLEHTGIVAHYVADFNKDQIEECVLVYLDTGQSEYYDEDVARIHIALLSDQNGQIEQTQDFLCCDFLDHTDILDLTIYSKKYQEDTFLIIQFQCGIQGWANEEFILSLDESGRFVIRKAIEDPGYTSGTGLYRNTDMEMLNNLADLSDYRAGREFFRSENSCIDQIKDEYNSAMEKEMSEYGMTGDLEVTPIRGGTPVWRIKPDSDMEIIAYLGQYFGEYYGVNGEPREVIMVMQFQKDE